MARTAAQWVELYEEAITKILSGQSYTLDGQSLTRPDLDKVTRLHIYWLDRMNKASIPVFKQIGFDRSR